MEIKEMVERARKAQVIYDERFDQERVDQVIKAAARTIFDHAEELARLTIDETQMGVYEDKVAKNRNKSKGVWYNLKGKKSMGILSIDERTNLIEIAKPIGVVAGITPMTNPVVTPMSKIIFALKTKNAIIIAPHPKAKQCSSAAVKLIIEAIAPFEVPEGLVQVIEEPTIEKTCELMEACDVVVATGGMPMVKSAYSSGKPSFGVGAGNVQVILDRFIDFDVAAEKVITGRSFDNFDEAIKIAKTNLFMEGNGHTAGIHSNNQANIIKAGTELSVSRLIVNAPCATTAGGSIQNGLPVTNTLGCGSWGNNSISENFTYKHLLNITRIAPLSARIHVPSDAEIWEL